MIVESSRKERGRERKNLMSPHLSIHPSSMFDFCFSCAFHSFIVPFSCRSHYQETNCHFSPSCKRLACKSRVLPKAALWICLSFLHNDFSCLIQKSSSPGQLPSGAEPSIKGLLFWHPARRLIHELIRHSIVFHVVGVKSRTRIASVYAATAEVSVRLSLTITWGRGSAVYKQRNKSLPSWHTSCSQDWLRNPSPMMASINHHQNCWRLKYFLLSAWAAVEFSSFAP